MKRPRLFLSILLLVGLIPFVIGAQETPVGGCAIPDDFASPIPSKGVLSPTPAPTVLPTLASTSIPSDVQAEDRVVNEEEEAVSTAQLILVLLIIAVFIWLIGILPTRWILGIGNKGIFDADIIRERSYVWPLYVISVIVTYTGISKIVEWSLHVVMTIVRRLLPSKTIQLIFLIVLASFLSSIFIVRVMSPPSNGANELLLWEMRRVVELNLPLLREMEPLDTRVLSHDMKQNEKSAGLKMTLASGRAIFYSTVSREYSGAQTSLETTPNSMLGNGITPSAFCIGGRRGKDCPCSDQRRYPSNTLSRTPKIKDKETHTTEQSRMRFLVFLMYTHLTCLVSIV